jgi:ADP-ribosylglycohydrolase
MRQPGKEHFSAALLGVALGDALGFPVEGYPPAITERYVSQFLLAGLAGQWKHYPFEFGQYSDDTQMTRSIIESINHCQGFDPEDVAHRFARLYETNKIIGQGRSTQEAVQRLIHGVPWKKAGTLPPTAGNSSTTRSLAIGLYLYQQPEEMVQAAYDQSWITHQDPRCLAGAVTVAGATALALTSENIEPPEFINQLLSWSRPISQEFADQLGQLPRWLDLLPEHAAGLIARAGIEESYQDNWHGISPFVTSSVIWSLYAFLKTPDDYWETICTAIAAGGDADTTAAIAGGIAGAHLGMAQLPVHLVRQLNDQGRWSQEKLTVLTDDLDELTTIDNPLANAKDLG